MQNLNCAKINRNTSVIIICTSFNQQGAPFTFRLEIVSSRLILFYCPSLHHTHTKAITYNGVKTLVIFPLNDI